MFVQGTLSTEALPRQDVLTVIGKVRQREMLTLVPLWLVPRRVHLHAIPVGPLDSWSSFRGQATIKNPHLYLVDRL